MIPYDVLQKEAKKSALCSTFFAFSASFCIQKLNAGVQSKCK